MANQADTGSSFLGFLGLVVTVCIAWITWTQTQVVSELQADTQLVGVAAEVLTAPPVVPGPDESAEAFGDREESDELLREWAVDVLEQASPVPLPEGLAEQFRDGTATLPFASFLGERDFSDIDFSALNKCVTADGQMGSRTIVLNRSICVPDS